MKKQSNKETKSLMDAIFADKKPFDHGFKESKLYGIIDVDGINGYSKCLADVIKHIRDVTDFSPGNRYIDSVQLLDRITLTLSELSNLLCKEDAKLSEIKNTVDLAENYFNNLPKT